MGIRPLSLRGQLLTEHKLQIWRNQIGKSVVQRQKQDKVQRNDVSSGAIFNHT